MIFIVLINVYKNYKKAFENSMSNQFNISILSDEEVMALTELQMLPEQDVRLSKLLFKQQAGSLGESEPEELQALMQIYQVGLLQKATALNEAVKRGLIEPLS